MGESMSQTVTLRLSEPELRFLDVTAADAPVGRARQVALRRLILAARMAAGEPVDLAAAEPLRSRVLRAYDEIAAALAAGSTLADVAGVMGIPREKHQTFRTYFSDIRRRKREQDRAIARALEAKHLNDGDTRAA